MKLPAVLVIILIFWVFVGVVADKVTQGEGAILMLVLFMVLKKERVPDK
jgi:hypothetical protein